jgi:hypothetical protein
MSRRALFLLPVLIAGATLLTSCDKPLPRVTVSGDGRVINLDASAYCFDADHCRNGKVSDYGDAPTLKITRGADILISVPKDVAEKQWIVTGFTLDASGTQAPISTIGSPVLHDIHTTRIKTPVDTADAFFVGIAELNGSGDTTGSWVVLVKPKN